MGCFSVFSLYHSTIHMQQWQQILHFHLFSSYNFFFLLWFVLPFSFVLVDHHRIPVYHFKLDFAPVTAVTQYSAKTKTKNKHNNTLIHSHSTTKIQPDQKQTKRITSRTFNWDVMGEIKWNWKIVKINWYEESEGETENRQILFLLFIFCCCCKHDTKPQAKTCSFTLSRRIYKCNNF